MGARLFPAGSFVGIRVNQGRHPPKFRARVSKEGKELRPQSSGVIET
jgi:hypothetical protein